MKTFFTTLLLLVASTSLFAQSKSCKQVTNASNASAAPCPYNVCFSFVLLNNGQPVPNSGMSVCHTVAPGATVSFCYPGTVPAGQTVSVTGINFISPLNISYNLPISSATSYYNVSPCGDGVCDITTYWQPTGPSTYQIAGECTW